MATVQLSDVIDVKVYNDLPAEDSPEKINLFGSGIIEQNPLLNELANSAGATAELPFWRDLDSNSAPNIATDNPATLATTDKITQGAQTTRKANLNKGYSAMDLARDLAMGEDAIIHIRNRVEAYWDRQLQRRIIASANGVMASNVANNSSDMVFNVAAPLVSGVGAGTYFTRGNFTSALFTLGDAFGEIAAIAVHSVVYKRIMDSGDIITIRPYEGSPEIPTYLGKRIIVDDGMPVTPGDATNAPKYTSILFGYGAFGYGVGTPNMPAEISRVAEAGNGAGEVRFWTRKTWIIHPFGFKVNDVTPASGSTYSPAELATAALWTRVVDRKNVPLAFLVTNG